MEQFIKYVGLDVHGKTIAAAVADSRSRLLFADNITRQPYFEGRNYRIATSYGNGVLGRSRDSRGAPATAKNTAFDRDDSNAYNASNDRN